MDTAALHPALLEHLEAAGQLDWSQAALAVLLSQRKRGPATGLKPTDHGKPGTRRHLVVDRHVTRRHPETLEVHLGGAQRSVRPSTATSGQAACQQRL